MARTLDDVQIIERSITKKYRKEIWTPFIGAAKQYQLINEGDKIAVCISGGKDSMLLAKLMQMLCRYSDVPFEVMFLVMDPGYNPQNRSKIESNAERLGIPMLLIRKKGKLPGATYSCKYALEYGTAEIEAHKSDIQAGKNYLVVDDLIATGGTLTAARNVIEQGGGIVNDFFGVIGLPQLNYRKVLEPSTVTTLIDYEGK